MTDMSNFKVVVLGVFVKTLGTIPACYVMMALFADVLDYLEQKNGFRCDGLSMSIYSIIMVGISGVVTAVFNGLISASGYIPPALVKNAMVAAEQNGITRGIFSLCFLGAETIVNLLLAVMLIFCNVEKKMQKYVRK